MGKVMSCIAPIVEAVLDAEIEKRRGPQTQTPQRNPPGQSLQPTKQQQQPQPTAPVRRAVHLRPPNDFEQILLRASQSMPPRERAIVEKLVIDFRSTNDRQMTAEEQRICLRVMQQFQEETSHMTNMAMTAAQGTQAVAANVSGGMNGLASQTHENTGSIGGLRQTIFDQGMAAENARQAATQARFNNTMMMQNDPETSGYNQRVRMHNQNVLDQVWATNHGQGFLY